MLLRDALLILHADRIRREEAWDRTRSLIATMINHSGFGASDPVDPKSLMHLSIDEEYTVPPVQNIDEALELLNEMLHG